MLYIYKLQENLLGIPAVRLSQILAYYSSLFL
nr:MAG TPA: hypothetical protein [Caudoviricetes sp.]